LVSSASSLAAAAGSHHILLKGKKGENSVIQRRADSRGRKKKQTSIPADFNGKIGESLLWLAEGFHEDEEVPLPEGGSRQLGRKFQ